MLVGYCSSSRVIIFLRVPGTSLNQTLRTSLRSRLGSEEGIKLQPSIIEQVPLAASGEILDHKA